MYGLCGLVLSAACLSGGGCIPRETQSVNAADPSNSIPAIQEAARKNDRTAIPDLIKQLECDDSAVRFYAIKALRDLTGQTLDYHYFDDAEERKPAVLRWRAWASEHA